MKKIFSVVLSLVMVFGSLPIIGFAEFTEEQNLPKFAYYEDNGEAVLTGVVCEECEVCEIPSDIDELPITKIENGAFDDCSAVKIVIPETVYAIQSEVFDFSLISEIEVSEENESYASVDGILYNKGKTVLIRCPECKTGEAVLPETVLVIAEKAFFNTQVTSVVSDEALSAVNNEAFKNSSVTAVFLPDCVTTLGTGIFYGCKDLVSAVLPDGITEIPENMFFGCSSLSEFNIPESVSSVGDFSFYNTALCSIYISDTVETVGEKAFGFVYSEETEFLKNEEFKVWGKKETTAEIYAVENGFEFVNINPASPELIEASADNECITFSWESAEGTDSYNIYRKTNGGVWEKIEEKYTDGTVFCDYNIKTGNVYEYSVSGGIGDFEGEYKKVGVSSEYIKLPTPALVSCEMGVNSITVTWKKVASCEGYILYRRTENTDWEEIGEFSASTVKYTDKNLESDNTYYYTVKCFRNELISNYDADGVSTYFLAVPTKLKAASASKGITVSWEKVKGANKYIIGRKTSSGSWVKIAEKGNVSSYTDKTAKTGVTYTYTVVSCKGDFKGLYYENGASARYLPAPEVTLKNTTSGVSLKWTKSAGASGYIVYRKTEGGKYTNISTVKGGSSLSFTDKTAVNGVKYIYNVKAYYGKYLSIFKATDGINNIYLKAPKISSAVSGKSGITVKWNKNSSAEKYYIYRKTTGGFTKIATVKGVQTVSYLDKTAKKGVKYTYSVKAAKGSYSSGYYESNSKAVCTDKY